MDSTARLLIFLAGSLTLFLLKFLHKFWWIPFKIQRALSLQGIKGPPYEFIHGNNKASTRFRYEALSKPMASLTHNIVPRVIPQIHSWINTYGQNYLTWEGNRAQLVISEPELIKEILKTNDGSFPKRKDDSSIIHKIVGEGLVTSEGAKWAKQRKLANHAFHGESLKNMNPAVIASVETMLEKWKGREGEEIEVFNEFRLLTSEVISRTAFGSNYLEGKKIFDMLTKLAILVSRNYFKTPIPGISKIWKTADEIESEKLANGIHDCVMEMVKRREKKVETGEADGFGNDFLGLLINAYRDSDEKNRFSIEDLVDECKTFYFAGQETTNSLLAWTILVLAIHTKWQEKTRQEVFEVFGDQNPNSEGIAKLKIILIPIIALHHDPQLWGDDVHLFKPERFVEGIASATKYNSAAFIPFSMGPRSCVGMSFATTETKVALSMILQRYAFTLSPTYVHAPFPVITLQPQHGIQVMLHPL
ncbi:hypothetical protein GOBAR_AA24919 [Gossypium barbadense]|uniref:Cytochrome P450 CYP749A22-like n=1 Tax=Gossypium barbadense TaxID=3634 RepID=A0A2P5WXB3_GOSBA|nr:hypothetical protein GOBAR_AA24919 [Gossypium barbadense]